MICTKFAHFWWPYEAILAGILVLPEHSVYDIMGCPRQSKAQLALLPGVSMATTFCSFPGTFHFIVSNFSFDLVVWEGL